MRKLVKYIATGLISATVSMSVLATDSLNIATDSATGFTGSFKADAHTVSFQSTLETATTVQFTITIDGTSREASFNLKNSELSLLGGKQTLTPVEQDLMYDTAQAVAAYVMRSQDDLGEHLVVLVGAMDYWSASSAIH